MQDKKPVLGGKLASLLSEGREAKLPDGGSILVRPFTLSDLATVDDLEPYELTGFQYASLKLWVVLQKHGDPEWKSDYPAWKNACDPIFLKKFADVVRVIEEVNASFQHRVPAGHPSRGNALSIEQVRDPPVGSPQSDGQPIRGTDGGAPLVEGQGT